jgi:hypothetical protein
LKYIKWFNKNFPDDIGFPDFLLEWTILLFKNNKLQEAEQKAFETFCRNTYLFDGFLRRPITPVHKWEGSNLETPAFAASLDINRENPGLTDFADWLESFIETERFTIAATKYIQIYKKLKTESDLRTRASLVRDAEDLKKNYLAGCP